jgi:hypothetical protein
VLLQRENGEISLQHLLGVVKVLAVDVQAGFALPRRLHVREVSVVNCLIRYKTVNK